MNLVSSGHTVEDSEDDEPLEDAELETLLAAGVIAPHTARKRKQSHSFPKHIVFAEDAEEGDDAPRLASRVLITIFQARQYLEQCTFADKAANNIPSTGSSGESELGWKCQDSAKSRRRRKKQSIVDGVDSTAEEKPDQVDVVRDYILIYLALSFHCRRTETPQAPS